MRARDSFSQKELEALLALDSKMTEVMTSLDMAKRNMLSSMRRSPDGSDKGDFVGVRERMALDSIFGEPSAAWPSGTREETGWLAACAIRAVFCNEDFSPQEARAMASILSGAPGEWLALVDKGRFLDETVSLCNKFTLLGSK